MELSGFNFLLLQEPLAESPCFRTGTPKTVAKITKTNNACQVGFMLCVVEESGRLPHIVDFLSRTFLFRIEFGGISANLALQIIHFSQLIILTPHIPKNILKKSLKFRLKLPIKTTDTLKWATESAKASPRASPV